MQVVKNNKGISLIEVTIIIVTIGILAAIAMQSMTVVVMDAKKVKTEREMESLTRAIVGDPSLMANGIRSDFGYIGDVGSFPPDLDALVSNPGGYSSWDGPYIDPSIAEDASGYKTDEWGDPYNYSGGTTITSTGSGSTLSKQLTALTTDYTQNTMNGYIYDAAGSIPDTSFMDSVRILVTYPNGSGGTNTKSYIPSDSGLFTLDSIPAGQHEVRAIYLPDNDTIRTFVTVLPNNKRTTTFQFTSAYFTTSGGGGGGGGSPSPGVETLRPNGDGSSDDLDDENCSNNWQCVDETSSDGNSTYVKGDGNNWEYDTYSLPASSIGSGTIDSVKVFIIAYGSSSSMKFVTRIRTNGSNYNGSQINGSTPYTEYSTNYDTNPQTGSAWTWSEINNLEIGVGIRREGRVTQVWVEVHYTN